MQKTVITATLLSVVAGAAQAMNSAMNSAKDNAMLPEPVRVPAGHVMKLETVGVGDITYECRERANMAGQYEWAFVAPVATLYDMKKNAIGKYYAGPTWEAMDGSKVTGKQVAVAPSGDAKSIPLQLVRAEPATGKGAMTGVSFIQRLETKAGLPPAMTCDAGAKGRQEKVAYEAKYVFWQQK